MTCSKRWNPYTFANLRNYPKIVATTGLFSPPKSVMKLTARPSILQPSAPVSDRELGGGG